MGAKGGRTANAWQWVWDRLSREEWQDGHDLAEQAAGVWKLKPVSVEGVLHRMAKEGYLERMPKSVPVVVTGKGGKQINGHRNRTHYRIIKEA